MTLLRARRQIGGTERGWVMPRRPRVFLEVGTYHVYCRVTRREPDFADREAAERFIEIVRVVPRSSAFRLRG